MGTQLVVFLYKTTGETRKNEKRGEEGRREDKDQPQDIVWVGLKSMLFNIIPHMYENMPKALLMSAD